MGDFTYLGRERLGMGVRLVAAADVAFDMKDRDFAGAALRHLLDDVFGDDSPDDGAIDQLNTVVAALHGDEDEAHYLFNAYVAEDDSIPFEDFLRSYALDDLRDALPWSIAEIDAGRGEVVS